MLCHALLVSMLSLEMTISLKLHFVIIILLNSTNIRFKEIRTLVSHVCSFMIDYKCALVSRFLLILLFNCVILKFLQFFPQFSSKTSWFYNLKTRNSNFCLFFVEETTKYVPKKNIAYYHVITMLGMCYSLFINKLIIRNVDYIQLVILDMLLKKPFNIQFVIWVLICN
jgi:hypothetical protein